MIGPDEEVKLNKVINCILILTAEQKRISYINLVKASIYEIITLKKMLL